MDGHDDDSGFIFHGNWREFLPIAATNLLLTLVTLGFYRFWATARERRYLWSRTQFIDERLEWTGTGREMFIGFLIALAIFVPLILFLQFGVQALIFRGMGGVAALGGLLAFAAILYLTGVAYFRALRYRLARTLWRGIRGGSNGSGYGFGFSYLWCSFLNVISIGLVVPWSMTTLWRERWEAMSFGPLTFEVGDGPATTGLYRFWLLAYLVIIVGLFVLFSMISTIATGNGDAPDPRDFVLIAIASMVIFYLVVPTAFLAYYAAFYRRMVGEMRLGGLDFDFRATTGDWLKLILGHIGLVIVTLGLGYVFIGYRNWSFFVRHMSVGGTIDASLLTQSVTQEGNDAEGLADAFDIGAI
jgi:uncharacterized membrane protein YjgN (DUF898 family)